MDLLLPGDPGHIGPFRVLGRLGEGGMGRVYLGASPGGRKVAIKTVHSHFANDGDFRRRFAREVDAARQVGGFHTALVVDADPEAEYPWMATAYISGPSLADAVEQEGPFDEAGVRELGAALSEGLAAIHACGIIHRDLKPTNVIVAADGPRIIDFGIAKGADATELTASHAVIGSLRYMSPEQLNGHELTPQSDVFALGAVLAYAGTGHDPFRASSVPAVINHILHDPPDLDPLAGQLRSAIGECLAKQPESRPRLSDLLARFTGQPRHDPTVITDPGPAPAAATATQPPKAVSAMPDRSVAPKPSEASTVHAVIGERQAAPAETVAPAAKPQPQRHRRRTGLIASAAAAVVVASTVTALALSRGPATHHASGAVPPARILSDPATSGASSVAFSPKGSILAVGDQNGNTYLWSLAKGERTAALTDPPGDAAFGRSNGVDSVAFSPDGGTLAVGDKAGSAYLWNVATQQITETVYDPSGYGVGADSVAFSPDGTTLAIGDFDGSTYLWSVAKDRIAAVFTPRRHSGVSSVAFSPDGATLAVGDLSGHTYLWDVASGHIAVTFTVPGRTISVKSVAFSPDGTALAVGDQSGSTYLWDLTAQKITTVFATPGDRGAESVAFSPDGTALAAGNGYGGTSLWDLGTGKVARAFAASRSQGTEGVAFSPDGSTLATGDAVGSTYLWTVPGHRS